MALPWESLLKFIFGLLIADGSDNRVAGVESSSASALPSAVLIPVINILVFAIAPSPNCLIVAAESPDVALRATNALAT